MVKITLKNQFYRDNNNLACRAGQLLCQQKKMKPLIILISPRRNTEGRLQKSNELQQRKCNLTMRRLMQARLATTFVIKRSNKSLFLPLLLTILASLSRERVKLQIMRPSMLCRISSSRKKQCLSLCLNQPLKKTLNQCRIIGKRVQWVNHKRSVKPLSTVINLSLVLTK